MDLQTGFWWQVNFYLSRKSKITNDTNIDLDDKHGPLDVGKERKKKTTKLAFTYYEITVLTIVARLIDHHVEHK